MTPRASDDSPEHDAWLREALRHAPDADARPPAEVSDAILRQARSAMAASTTTAVSSVGAASSTAAQATQPAARRNGLGFWREAAAFWSWLARPAVATGFASVMVATLVGLMWWNRPLDEALPHSPTVAQAPAAASPAPAPAPAPAPESAPALETSPAPAARPAPATAPAPSSAPQPAGAEARPAAAVAAATAAFPPTTSADADRAAALGQSAQARTSVAGARKPPSSADAPAIAAAPGNEAGPAGPTGATGPRPLPLPPPPPLSDQRRVVTGAMADAAVPESPKTPPAPAPAAAPAPATVPVPAPAPAPEAAKATATAPVPAPAGAAAGLPGRAAERETAGLAQRSREPAAADAIRTGVNRAAKAVADEAPAAATSHLTSRADLARDASSLTALQAAVSAQPQRWAWQRGSGPQQAMNPAVEQWLSRLDASTRPPQKTAAPVSERNPNAAQADSTPLLRLWRDGQLHALLRIGVDTVRLDVLSEPAAAWQVSISTADAAAMLRALDEATR